MSEIKPAENEADVKEEIVENDQENQDAMSTDADNISLMDELRSLEREIAQMHHMPTAPVVAHRVDVEGSGEVDDGNHGDKVLLEMQPASRNSTPGSQEGVAAKVPLIVESGDDDLIAVLKGLDRASEDDEKGVSAEHDHGLINESELVEGVTIEGEGEFQIMEVVDDEGDDVSNAAKPESSTKPAIVEVFKTSSVNIAKLPPKLTREEERAMAMEQIAGLTRVERQRRRKQDLQSTGSSDLISTLKFEGNDDGNGEHETNKTDGGAVAVTAHATVSSTTTDELRATISSSPKNSNDKMKKTSRKNTPTEENSNASIGDDALEVPAVDAAVSPPSTGFRRTRIIKRKIIWDPDAPETNISYSQLVRGTTKSQNDQSSATTKPSTQLPNTPHPAKKARPNTPKHLKVQNAKASTDNGVGDTPSSNKKQSQTPVVNGSAKKKKISEVDRLMGDEGAVNMLNSLESERCKTVSDPKNEKPLRPLMRKRASTISERFVRREPVPIATLKRDSVPVSPKVKRAAKVKPSATWDYVYKQKASDDAMIIRRRSNSSYSSSASQQRLSIDAPPPLPLPVNTSKAAPNKAANAVTSSTHENNEASPSVAAKIAAAAKVKNSIKSDNDLTGKNSPFEFIKPESKINHKTNRRNKEATQGQVANTSQDGIKKTPNVVASNRSRSVGRSPATVQEKVEKSGKTMLITAKEFPSSTADVIIKKTAKIAQIIFNTQKAKISHTFTELLLNKLIEALSKLSADSDCNAVVMITNAPNFCQGLDVSDLVYGTGERSISAAQQLAATTKKYMKTLATFPKPIIAGVNGANIGFGVTQLALFDIVVASDKSSFEARCAKIGHIPEGYCIWNNSTKIRDTTKTALFWLCEKLQSSESVQCGLVNKIVPSHRVNDEAILLAKKIAACSVETYRVMKSNTIKNHLEAILTSLDEEFDIIANQWTTSECLEHFENFLALGHV